MFCFQLWILFQRDGGGGKCVVCFFFNFIEITLSDWAHGTMVIYINPTEGSVNRKWEQGWHQPPKSPFVLFHLRFWGAPSLQSHLLLLGAMHQDCKKADGLTQALKEGKAAKKREPALTCSEAQGKKQEQGWILYGSKAQGKGMCWGESRRKKVGRAGAGICTLYPSPPKGWTGIWDISAGGVVVSARTCGSNPQNASLHAQSHNSSEL